MNDSEPSIAYQPSFLGDKREELTEILRSRLIECGWRDKVAKMCRDLIQKHGVEQIRLEQIIGEVRPKAKQAIPEQVKTELLDMIRKLDQNQLETQSQQSGEHMMKRGQQQHLQSSQPTLPEHQPSQIQSSTESASNISLL